MIAVFEMLPDLQLFFCLSALFFSFLVSCCGLCTSVCFCLFAECLFCHSVSLVADSQFFSCYPVMS